MPTYSYICTKCNDEFEVTQSVKDSPLKKCPKCNRRSLERQIFAPIVVSCRGEPKTLGQLAELNTKKQGSLLKEADEASGAKKRRDEANLTKRINKMTMAQKIKYIEEG